MAETFNTTFVIEIILKIPRLNCTTDIYKKCHLTNNLFNYNLILGRDLLHELKIKLSLSKKFQSQ